MKALLGAFLMLCSLLASAQTQINVLYVYSPGAVGYLQQTFPGQTLVTASASMTSQANALYAGTGVQFNTVGSINATWCCGPDEHFWYDFVPPVSNGALQWAQNDIRTAILRDGTGADIVVIVGDYERGLNPNAPNDLPGASVPSCLSSGGAVPKSAFVGVNIAMQLNIANQPVLAHELGHQLCMNHTGWYKKTGSTPADCEVRWTIEYGDSYDATYPAYSHTYALYDYQQGAHMGYITPQRACDAYWLDRHNRIDAHFNTTGTLVQNGSTLNCDGTYDTGQYAGSGTIVPYSVTESGPAFTCGNAMQVPFFAGSGAPPGYSGGTLVRNSIAAMNAQAPLTAAFRNTKLAAGMIRKAIAAVLP